jgi:hypothetical protein
MQSVTSGQDMHRPVCFHLHQIITCTMMSTGAASRAGPTARGCCRCMPSYMHQDLPMAVPSGLQARTCVHARIHIPTHSTWPNRRAGSSHTKPLPKLRNSPTVAVGAHAICITCIDTKTSSTSSPAVRAPPCTMLFVWRCATALTMPTASSKMATCNQTCAAVHTMAQLGK